MKWNRVLALASLVAVGALAACDDDEPPTGVIDPPAAVTGLAATSVRSSNANVWEWDVTASWDASADADEYVARLVQGSDTTTTTVTTTTAAFAGVRGGSYSVSVVASNDGGDATATSGSFGNPGLNQTFFETAGYNNVQADPMMDASVFEFGTQGTPPDFSATMPAGYTAATLPTTGFQASVDGRTLTQTAYAGAIDPAAGSGWHEGWTIWSESGTDSRDVTGMPTDTVDADILADVTWDADTVYVLVKPVFIGADCGTDGSAAGCNAVTLTIEPGTTIIGLSAAEVAPERGAYLVVNRGSRLVADATPGTPLDAPVAPTEAQTIVFTSSQAVGSKETGGWGGIVINGQAPTNSGAEAEGEGDSGLYGGTDADDDSGILRGVRIEYAGDDVTPTDQLNGLALQGVGAGTTLSYIQIHYNQDDGIEPFGGTASVDHLVVTGIGDDSVDGTDGYMGWMQFIIGQQNGVNADNGFEISNNGDDEDATPHGSAVITNATMIGAGQNVVSGGIGGVESDNGIQFREGSYYRVYNSIFTGFGEGGFCIRDAQTIANALTRMGGATDPGTTLSAEGLIMWSNQAAGASAENFAACGGGSS